MSRPVALRHVAVLGLDQYAVILIDEKGAEWMIAMPCGAASDLERHAQKMPVASQRCER